MNLFLVIMEQMWLSFQQINEVSKILEVLNFDDASVRRMWSEPDLELIRDAFEIWNIYKMDIF